MATSGGAGIDLAFANLFIDRRLAGFRKDMAICLTPDKNDDHAYLPALLLCIANLELFAGLKAGSLDLGQAALKAIEAFRTAYLPMGCYTNENLAILHKAFRHRIAHIGEPNVMYRLGGKNIVWTIYEFGEPGKPALELTPHVDRIRVTSTPWPVNYDHRFRIRLPVFQADLESAVAAYKRDLAQRADLLRLFAKAVEPSYPR